MTKRKSLLIVISLFATFFLPMLLAWFQYAHKYSWGSGLDNRGMLVIPPLPISELPINHLQQHGKWLMILFYPKACTENCQKALYQMRQLRIAMNADQNRLQRVILTYPIADKKLSQLLQTTFAETEHATVDPQKFSQIAHHYFKINSIQAGSLYIVDPHGNLMMRYQPNADPKGIFKDLQKLLRVSQIG